MQDHCRGESCIRPANAPPQNIMQVNRNDLPQKGEHEVRPYGPWTVEPCL